MASILLNLEINLINRAWHSPCARIQFNRYLGVKQCAIGAHGVTTRNVKIVRQYNSINYGWAVVYVDLQRVRGCGRK